MTLPCGKDWAGSCRQDVVGCQAGKLIAPDRAGPDVQGRLIIRLHRVHHVAVKDYNIAGLDMVRGVVRGVDSLSACNIEDFRLIRVGMGGKHPARLVLRMDDFYKFQPSVIREDRFLYRLKRQKDHGHTSGLFEFGFSITERRKKEKRAFGRKFYGKNRILGKRWPETVEKREGTEEKTAGLLRRTDGWIL